MNTVTEPVRLDLIEPPEPAHQLAPQQRQLTVVEYAMQNGASPADLKALLEMQIQADNHKREMRRLDDERDRELRAEAARIAFNEAMRGFKAEAVKVIRSKKITDGPLKGKKHADLFAVTDAATEALSKHGLSVSWETLDDSKEWIRIACRVKHVAGHSESVPFGGPVDTGPGRNAIQARKSTITYLERFTMLMALGLAEQDADDDGQGAGTPGRDISGLLTGLKETRTDDAAHAYWMANRDSLKDDRAAYERFKADVVAHRQSLKKGGAQ